MHSRRGSRSLALVVLASLWAVAGSAAAQQPKRPAPKPPAKPAPVKPAAPAPAAAKPPAPPPPSDIVVKTQYVAGDKNTISTISAKGPRERIDYGTEMSVITQCDAGRLVQMAEQTKRYLVSPLDAGEPQTKKKGGVVTFTTSVTDTGEKKSIFGQDARHLKIVMTKEPASDACDKKKQRVETDGWFIDRPAVLACSSGDRRPVFAVTNNCRDDLVYVDPAVPVGSPLSYTAVTVGDDNKASTMTMEVTGYERVNLPESLFAVPEGYTEAKTLADLTAASKRSGVTRVGVVAVGSKVKDELSLQVLSQALLESLSEVNVDAVALEASSAASAIAEARAKACDYLLVTDVTDLRKPSKSIVGRVSGARDFGAKVDFMLTAPGAATPLLSGSERSGASNLQLAVKTAQTAYKYATPMGLLGSRFNFMQTYMAMAGQTGTVPAQSPDPVMNTLFSMLNSATGADKPQVPLESADAAVAAAMEKEVAAIAAKLGKP